MMISWVSGFSPSSAFTSWTIKLLFALVPFISMSTVWSPAGRVVSADPSSFVVIGVFISLLLIDAPATGFELSLRTSLTG